MGIIETQYDRANDLTVHIATGKITASEIFEVVQKSLAENPSSKVLWNCLEADGADIPSEEFRSLHVKISKLPNSHKLKKLASLVSSDINYGLSRMSLTYATQVAEQMGHGAKFHTFRSLEKAMEWLDGAQE
jgi:hypothetical protein